MIIGITKEISPHENRIALTPQTAAKYKKLGFSVIMEQHAGLKACFSDHNYTTAGVQVLSTASEVLTQCDIWLKIRAPQISEIKHLKNYSFIIGDFQGHKLTTQFDFLKKHHITCYALNQLERISRAQPFDVLSSQNNLAGYQAVIRAASLYPSVLPLMITSAGTIAPAKILIIGIGVAGLQAIATARRLGAKVYAYDINSNLKEQAESLGAKFVNDFIPLLPELNIIITAAFTPDKKAPLIITADMLKKLPPHAVLLDMAANYGGNIFKSSDHKTTRCNGCIIYGAGNLASEIPLTASELFANNLYNFINFIYSQSTNTIHHNLDDSLLTSTLLIKG